jgi:alkylation response protein AidB-like acyl-CoA dehydrogenase
MSNIALPLRTERQALDAARAAALRIAELARDPANNEQLPSRQAQWLSDYGLTAIGVPSALGGLGASVHTQVEVVRIISTADGGVGQLLQIHYVMLRGILEDYSTTARQRIVSDVLAGKRLANALAEVGGKNKFALKTRVERRADGQLVLNGSKFYSTGAYLADWIWLAAASEQGGAGIWLHRDTPGLSLVDDWRAFGQQHSVSGTVRSIHQDTGRASESREPSTCRGRKKGLHYAARPA